MKSVDQKVLALVANQHGLITRRQFLGFGSVGQLERRLAAGALLRLYEGVYRLPAVAQTWKQALFAACLSGRRPNAVSFRAAAQMQHLPGGEELIEITSRRHNRIQAEGVIAHETLLLDEIDFTYIDGIPVTRPARTLCDLAGLVELGKLDQATVELALLEAMRRNLVDIPLMWHTLHRLRGTFRLGGAVMNGLLTNYVQPLRSVESPAEARVLQILRENGFPEPVPQFSLVLPDGRNIRLDFAWPDIRVGFEWDPYKYHGDLQRYERMAERTRLMRAIGWERVCVTDADLAIGMPQSLATLRQIFDEHKAPVRP